jgi:hypothetical protein
MRSQCGAINQCLLILKYSGLPKIEKLKLEVQVRHTRHLLSQLSEDKQSRDQQRATRLNEVYRHFDALYTESKKDQEIEKISELLGEINNDLRNEIQMSN